MRLESSLPRRLAGVFTFALLGAMMVWMGLATSPAPGWAVFLVSGGGIALFLSIRLWQVTDITLELTEYELREAGGRQIAETSNIKAVERGAFAFKPSNGFLVRLRTRAVRAYVPGIWWRVGTRIGVGGVTNAAQAKAMADIIAAVATDMSQNGHASG